MIHFERSFDYYGKILAIFIHPAVFPHIMDDPMPPVEEFVPIQHPTILYMLAYDGDELLGMWAFHPENRHSTVVHTCLLPTAGYRRGREAARLMAQWIWAHTTFDRITTSVPQFNRAALLFAKAAGMKQFGNNPKSFFKYGQLHDQILLGMSRPEEV